MKTGVWIGLAMAPLCACTPAYPILPPLPEKASPFTAVDAVFLQNFSEHDQTRIAISHLATDHARSPEIRTLGAGAEKAYEAHRKSLAALASKHSLTLTDTLSTKDQAGIDRLTTLFGPRFDHAYLMALRDGAVEKNEVTASLVVTSKNGDVKTVATDMQELDRHYRAVALSLLPQPTIRQHQKAGQK